MNARPPKAKNHDDDEGWIRPRRPVPGIRLPWRCDMNTRLVKRCELQVFDFRHLLEWNTRVVGLLELILLQNFCLAEGITVQWRADRLRVPIFSAGRQAGRFKIQFSSFRKFRTGRAIFCENWILNRPACCLPKKSGPSTYQLLTVFLPDAGIAFLPHIECEGGRENSYFRQRNWVQAREAQIRCPAGRLEFESIE